MKLTLDYPPSGNRYWRHNRGHIHRSAEADAYIRYVALLCAAAGVQPLDGDVRVQLNFYRPAKRGDLDNGIKVLVDSLQGYGYHNDSQIAELHARRFEDKHAPRVEVEIVEVEG